MEVFFTLSLWGAYICTVRRILWRFLTCVRHSLWRSCPGYVLKVYYWWRNCLWLAFRKQFAGKAYLEINLLVKTPLHIVVWKLDAPGYGLLVGYVDPGGAEVCVWGGWGRGEKKLCAMREWVTNFYTSKKYTLTPLLSAVYIKNAA